MASLLGIVAGIALVLAVVVTALVVGVCLLLSWLTNAFRSDRGRPQQPATRGGGRHSNQAPPFRGQQPAPPYPGQQPPRPYPGQQAPPQFPGQQPQDRYRRAGRLPLAVARGQSVTPLNPSPERRAALLPSPQPCITSV
jgi:hypothetical protein